MSCYSPFFCASHSLLHICCVFSVCSLTGFLYVLLYRHFIQCLETDRHDYTRVLSLIVLFATCTVYCAMDTYVCVCLCSWMWYRLTLLVKFNHVHILIYCYAAAILGKLFTPVCLSCQAVWFCTTGLRAVMPIGWVGSCWLSIKYWQPAVSPVPFTQHTCIRLYHCAVIRSRQIIVQLRFAAFGSMNVVYDSYMNVVFVGRLLWNSFHVCAQYRYEIRHNIWESDCCLFVLFSSVMTAPCDVRKNLPKRPIAFLAFQKWKTTLEVMINGGGG